MFITSSLSALGNKSAVPPLTNNRLIIKTIDVENFKSYAGKHTIGPFHKTFTAIIGPNGSGKSNIIDSMLFVFGRNAKKIRLEKLSELIHNSSHHRKCTRAIVTVNFVQIRESEMESNNPNEVFEIPGTQLSIGREVYINNHSQYFINGKKSIQKEVMETLIGLGIDLEHNRFLILQGEVEQIALMKPKAEQEGEEGLVEYLDDLIGSNQYVGRVKEFTKIVEDKQEERLAVLDALRKVQGERDVLAGAKDSTLSFLRKDIHLQRMITVLCQIRLQTIEQQLIEPRRRIKKQEEAISSLIKKITKEKENMVGERTHVASLQAMQGECLKEKDALKKEKDKVELDVAQLKASFDESDRMKKHEMDRLKRVRDGIQKLHIQAEDSQRDTEIAERHISDAQELLAKLQPEYEAQTDNLQVVQAPIRVEIEKLKQELAPYEEACTKAEQQLEDSRYKLQMLKTVEDRRCQELGKLEQDKEVKQVRYDQLSEAITQASEELYGSDDQMSVLQEEQARTVKLKFFINAQIETIKREYRDTEAGDNAQRFLLSQRNLTGYYGTLRQLGRIDGKYDIAAGVASNMWDYHVVEDESTAVEVVNLLKQQGLRATMMVLRRVEQEQGKNMRAPFSCPAGTQRLFDLITPTHLKFTAVFYQAVRNTLVAPDLATARSVAFGNTCGSEGKQGQSQRLQRRRLVTLRGELVEPSGAVTGGGQMAPRAAKLKAMAAPADRQATFDRLKALQADLEVSITKERECTAKVQQLSRSRGNYSHEDLSRMRTEMSSLKSAIAHISARIEELRGIMASHTAQKGIEGGVGGNNGTLGQLQQNVNEAERALEKTQKARVRLAASVNDKEAQLQCVGGDKYKQLCLQLQTTKTTLAEQERVAHEAKRAAQKNRASIESKSKELERTQATIDRIQSEQDSANRTQLQDKNGYIEELDSKIRILAASIAKLEKEINDVEAAVAAQEKLIHDITDTKDDHIRAKEELLSTITAEQEDIAKIERRITDAKEKAIAYVREFGIIVIGEQLAEQFAGGEGGRRGQKRRRGGENEEGGGGSNDKEEENDNSSENEEEDENVMQSEGNEEKTVCQRNSSARPQRYGDDEGIDDEESGDEFDANSFTLMLSNDKLSTYERPRCEMLARELQEECRRLRSTINFEAVAIWREKQHEFKKRKATYETILATLNDAEANLDEIIARRRAIFMESFHVIQRKLKEMYQLLAHGGDADVELVDASDPYEGVNFTVRPPKKSWKQVSNLSGGEKTLSSLALVFALHHIRPNPIYVMDEIDAALDFRNVSIVARYVLEQARGAQFVIISLRNNMFELAHQLVGICKVNDVTRSLTLNPAAMTRTIEAQLTNAQLQNKQYQRRKIHGSEREMERVNEKDHSDRNKKYNNSNGNKNLIITLSNENEEVSRNYHNPNNNNENGGKDKNDRGEKEEQGVAGIKKNSVGNTPLMRKQVGVAGIMVNGVEGVIGAHYSMKGQYSSSAVSSDTGKENMVPLQRY